MVPVCLALPGPTHCRPVCSRPAVGAEKSNNEYAGSSDGLILIRASPFTSVTLPDIRIFLIVSTKSSAGSFSVGSGPLTFVGVIVSLQREMHSPMQRWCLFVLYANPHKACADYKSDFISFDETLQASRVVMFPDNVVNSGADIFSGGLIHTAG